MFPKSPIHISPSIVLRVLFTVMIIGFASASPKYAFADEIKSDSGLSAADEPCPEGNINVDLPQAPAGKVSTMVITIDENCQPVYGPIKFVAPDEADVESNDKNVVAGSFDEVRVSTLSLDPSLGADYTPLAGGSTCFTAFLRLNDVVGLQLNKVYGNVCWSWSGTIVTSASAGGGWQAQFGGTRFPRLGCHKSVECTNRRLCRMQLHQFSATHGVQLSRCI